MHEAQCVVGFRGRKAGLAGPQQSSYISARSNDDAPRPLGDRESIRSSQSSVWGAFSASQQAPLNTHLKLTLTRSPYCDIRRGRLA